MSYMIKNSLLVETNAKNRNDCGTDCLYLYQTRNVYRSKS